jgi:hypothetical protein
MCITDKDIRQWVAYMDDDNKAVRTALWKSLGFGGTTDWAVDLAAPIASSPNTPDDPSKGYYFGAMFLEHSKTYVPGSNGTIPYTRDWCENVQAIDQPVGGFPRDKQQSANNMGWMSIHCDIPEIKNIGFKYTARERWAVSTVSANIPACLVDNGQLDG